MRCELVRDAGREPMFIVDNSTMGVIARNHSSNPGVSYTRRRYAACDAVDNSSAMRTNCSVDVIRVPSTQHRRLDRRGHQCFEVLAGALRVGELRGDHLALLGHAQAHLHTARRLGHDRVIAGPAAATDGAAAAVEQSQHHVVGLCCNSTRLSWQRYSAQFDAR